MDQDHLATLIHELKAEQARIEDAIQALENLYLSRSEREREGAAWLRRHRLRTSYRARSERVPEPKLSKDI